MENNNETEKRLNSKKTTNKFITRVSKTISTIFLLLYFVSMIILVKVNILPTKFLLGITIFLAAISGTFFYLQLFKELKNKTRIIINVISVIFIIVLSLGSIYCLQFNKFLNTVTSSDYETKNYSIIVLKDSTFNELTDLDNTAIGYVSNEDTDPTLIKNELDKHITYTLAAYDDVGTLKDGLLNKDIPSIIVEDSQKAIIEEESPDFFDKAKVIYTFGVKTSVESISKDAQVSAEPFNIYISGIDTYGDISTVSRSDVNIIATINPNTHQILLTNIPRDSYVQLHGTKGYKDKLTHAGIYGVDMSIKTIEDLLNIDINYYFKVNFSSVESIVDAIGGITAYSKYSFTSYIGNYHFNAGFNNMNGEQALAFARERKSFQQGDIMRGQNQQAVIEAILRKATSPSIITKYSSLLNILSNKFQTNMPIDKITELIKYQISESPKWTVTSITLDGTGSNEYTYSYSAQKLSVVILNQASVTSAKEKIASAIAGTKFDSSYNEVTNPTNPTKVNPPPTTQTTNNTSNTNTETPVENNNTQNNTTNNNDNQTNNNTGTNDTTTTTPPDNSSGTGNTNDGEVVIY